MSTDGSGLRATVAIPRGVTVEVRPGRLVVAGPKGRVERPFPDGVLRVDLHGTEAELILRLDPKRKRSRSLLGTWVAHLRNLSLGVAHGVEARLKIVAAHFPMKVAAKGSTLVIENFLGEKYPRTATLVPGTTAEVAGEFVTISGIDVEQVGQSAANVERATRIRQYDPRVFQDGIYLIERARIKEADS